MKHVFTTLALLVLASPTMAAFQIALGSTPETLPLDNNFRDIFIAAGLTTMSDAADVLVTGPGVISFYYLGSESGFSNALYAGVTEIKTETSGGIEPVVDLIGVSTGPILAAIDGYFGAAYGIKFKATNGNLFEALAGTEGFGVFLPAGYAGGPLTDVYLAFDDHGATPEDNHDDILIRAHFEGPISTSVPEATSLFAWMGLVGAFGIAYASSGRLRSRIAGA